MDFPKRGDIWLVSLEPVVGHEIGKTRPSLVISNNRNNQFADTVTVLPITSKTEKIYPFETYISKEEAIGNVKIAGVKTHLVVPYVKRSDDVKVVTVYPCRNINKEIGNKEAKR
ncbi:MAG: type II toxin-antitoxin system PemK/MazF family toxin [Candidatus Scalindua sp.]